MLAADDTNGGNSPVTSGAQIPAPFDSPWDNVILRVVGPGEHGPRSFWFWIHRPLFGRGVLPEVLA